MKNPKLTHEYTCEQCKKLRYCDQKRFDYVSTQVKKICKPCRNSNSRFEQEYLEAEIFGNGDFGIGPGGGGNY